VLTLALEDFYLLIKQIMYKEARTKGAINPVTKMEKK